jgi:hypothetical protein
MPNLRPSLVAACLMVVLTGPIFAQGESAAAPRQPVDTTADVLVLDHDYASGAQEYARVFLESGQVYRGEFSSPDVRTAGPRSSTSLGGKSGSSSRAGGTAGSPRSTVLSRPRHPTRMPAPMSRRASPPGASSDPPASASSASGIRARSGRGASSGSTPSPASACTARRHGACQTGRSVRCSASVSGASSARPPPP